MILGFIKGNECIILLDISDDECANEESGSACEDVGVFFNLEEIPRISRIPETDNGAIDETRSGPVLSVKTKKRFLIKICHQLICV